MDYYNYEIDEHDLGTTFKDDGTNYLTDKLTNYATEFIEKQNKDNPFFLFLSYSAPHVLTVPRGDKLAKYFWKYEKFGGKYNPNYAAMIESVDDGVGEIIKLLKEKGFDENTIVIFTSDNGGVGLAELGPITTTVEGLKKWKGFVYEGGIRIPLIISWKGKLASNITNENVVSNTDFFNTFLEITGQKSEIDLDSKSFKNVLDSPATQFDRGDYWWHYPHFSNQTSRPAGSLRLGDWKVVRSYETQQVELYNLRTDEAESNDLATKFPQKSKELNALLKNRLADYQANMPVLKSY